MAYNLLLKLTVKFNREQMQRGQALKSNYNCNKTVKTTGRRV